MYLLLKCGRNTPGGNMIIKSINLDAIVSNFKKIVEVKQKIIFPVVKNDAYGNGAVRIINELQKRFAVPYFCVASVVEIMQRQLLKKTSANFLVFDTPRHFLDNQRITYSINDEKDLLKVAKLKNRNIHIYFDVGHGRGSITSFAKVKKIYDLCAANDINVEGIYTHIRSTSDTAALNKIKDVFDFFETKVKYLHAVSSECLVFDLGNTIRIGSALFGDGINDGYRQAISIYTKIRRVIKVKTGDTFGYDPGFIAADNGYVFELDTGYHDGFLKDFSGLFLLIDEDFLLITNAITMNKVYVFSKKIHKAGDRAYITKPVEYPINSFVKNVFYGPALPMIFHETLIEWEYDDHEKNS